MSKDLQPITPSPGRPGDLAAGGSNPPRTTATDERLIDLWLARFTSSHTRRSYSRTIGELFGVTGRPIAATTLEDLSRWVATLRDLGLSAATIRQRMAAVKSLWSFALATGYVRLNPAAALRSPRAHQRLDQPPTVEEVVLMLQAAQHDRRRGQWRRNVRLFVLLYFGALRISEATGARWADVTDREGGIVQLTIIGKGEQRRAVLFRPSRWDLIEEMRGDGFSWNRTPPFESEWICPARGGGRLSTRGARDIVYRISEAAIGRRIRPHELRHAHATHAIERGCPIALVTQTLGHADLKTTSAYIHARPNDGSGLWLS